MKLRHLCVIILVSIAAPGLRAADLYSLYPAASSGISLDRHGGETLILARLAGNNGGAALFRVGNDGAPEPLSSFEYGQRDASAISESDMPVKIIRTADRGYALLVELMSYSAPRAGIKREAAIWLIKLSAAGKREWAEVYSESGLGYKPFGILQTSDGGYLITGSTMQGKVWKSLLFKTDNRGKLTWKKSIPSGSYASFGETKQLENGGYLLYGYETCRTGRITGWSGPARWVSKSGRRPGPAWATPCAFPCYGAGPAAPFTAL